MTAQEIPALQHGDKQIESMNMPVIVLWGNATVSRFLSMAAAKAAVTNERFVNRDGRGTGAKAFAWDGTHWDNLAID